MRAPSFTPNALSANSALYTPAISSARGDGCANCGKACATWLVSAAATPALEVTLQIHISAPVRKPGERAEARG